MMRLAIRFALVLCVLFLTFPVRNAYAFANSWDSSSAAWRFLSFVTYVFYSGVSLKGGLAWYAGLAGMITAVFLVGDIFLSRVRLEAGSVFDKNKWKSGGVKPLALLTLLTSAAVVLWTLAVGGLLYLHADGEILLHTTSNYVARSNVYESAGWGALMLLAAWPAGRLLTGWCRD